MSVTNTNSNSPRLRIKWAIGLTAGFASALAWRPMEAQPPQYPPQPAINPAQAPLASPSSWPAMNRRDDISQANYYQQDGFGAMPQPPSSSMPTPPQTPWFNGVPPSSAPTMQPGLGPLPQQQPSMAPGPISGVLGAPNSTSTMMVWPNQTPANMNMPGMQPAPPNVMPQPQSPYIMGSVMGPGTMGMVPMASPQSPWLGGNLNPGSRLGFGFGNGFGNGFGSGKRQWLGGSNPKSVWDRINPIKAVSRRYHSIHHHLQDSMFGYPEYFAEPPHGYFRDEASRIQQAKTEIHKYTLYRSDFKAGTDQLSPTGAARLNMLAMNVGSWTGPLIVEWTPEEPDLAESRKGRVLTLLQNGGISIAPERFLIGPPTSFGLPGAEADVQYAGMESRYEGAVTTFGLPPNFTTSLQQATGGGS